MCFHSCGGRWNTAFTDLTHENLFKPLNRHVGPRAALFLVFVISERSKVGRKLGLGSGLRGWCFLALITGPPAFWLFNPVFIHNVILPILHAIGTT
jgi:hypothetical protein